MRSRDPKAWGCCDSKRMQRSDVRKSDGETDEARESSLAGFVVQKWALLDLNQ